MHMCNNDVKLFKDLLRFLYSQEQPLILYYGTEYGLTHNYDVNVSSANSDLQARGIINWDEKVKYLDLIQKLGIQRQQRYS